MACLYRHFDASGKLLYVGIAGNPQVRTDDHMRVSSWATKIARIDVEWFPSRDAALAEERRLILELQPPHNKHHRSVGAYPRPTFDGQAVHADLVARIRAFCDEQGMPVSTFGTEAVGDPRFVSDLEKGRECRSKTLAKVEAFIAAQVAA